MDGTLPAPQAPASQPKFGTFLGVYTPSVLTILGLIMYLRFGWVLGNVGLAVTLLIVLLASSITFITALSASAIGTNMRVGVGGEYYMISRSLGLELGGAIGIPLFLCRTLSITFYAFGLSESILAFWPAAWGEMPWYLMQSMTAVIIVIITAVAGKSAAVALKVQIPIMIAVGLSILALAAGVFTTDLATPELTSEYRTAPGFWYVFAVFFPAVTGFSAGIGMSGDLKDPRRSIPRGTLLAVLTGTLVYVAIPILLAFSSKTNPEELAEPGIIWIKVAVLGAWLVYPGVWGALLSSVFGSILGGPRVLQALAKDGLAPRFLAKVSPTGQPTIATWVSGGIALVAVALGGLNTVAQFVTILFLTLYVTINLSAALEKLVGDPSYRPTINVPWYVSLLGTVGAIMVMFLISPLACILAIALEVVLFWFLRRRAMTRRWGDVRAGFWLSLARFSLLKLKEHGVDPRNWRPQILLFAGDVGKRIGLVRMANNFNQHRGVVTVCDLLVGGDERAHTAIQAHRDTIEAALDAEGMVAFSQVNIVRDFEWGALTIIQANGLGGLRPNTVMFGWPEKEERLEAMLRIMRKVHQLGKSTIITRLKWAHEPGRQKRIDVWWRGMQNNGDLMLLLAHLLNLNLGWTDAKIYVRSVVNDADELAQITANLRDLMPAVRINAETEVILKPADKTVIQVMHEASARADVVFLGLFCPPEGEEASYATRLIHLAEGFNTTIFVHNAGDFAGRLL